MYLNQVLLRQQRLRHLGRRQRLLRQGPHLRRAGGPAHRQRGRHAGRARPGAVAPRPDHRGGPGGGRRRDALRRAGDGAGDHRAQLRARPDARVRVHHPGGARRGDRRGDRARAAARQRLPRAALRVRRPPRGERAARGRGAARHRRPAHHHHARLRGLPGHRREVGADRLRPRSAQRRGADREVRRGGAAVDQPAPGPEHQQRRDRDRQLPHRRRAGLRRARANFYGEATPEHQPNFDVIGQAYRQSGSAFKPITYATGFESGVISPATMFMDVRTDIADGFDPPERRQPRARPGPRARRAEVLAQHPGQQGAAAHRLRERGGHGRAAGARVRPAPQRRVRRAVAHARHARHPPARPGRRVRRDRQRRRLRSRTSSSGSRTRTATSSTTTPPMPTTATRSSPPPPPTS